MSKRGALAAATPALGAPVDSRPVRLSRSTVRVNPQLARAYDALLQGNFEAARQDYEHVIQTEPNSVDALNGLASIALREGRSERAEAYFQRALSADPHDSFAISGLAGLSGRSNPGASEARLKNLGANQPELAAPAMALGSLLSAQGRWSEAQEAWFKAYTLEAGNPDILFNLAVSLEHLRQPKLAAHYYALAIDAAGHRPAGFERAEAAARVRALQPQK